MRKSDRMILLVYCAVGMILIGAGIITDIDYYSTLMFSLGFALIFSSVLQFYRFYRDSKPENAEKAEARQRQQKIDLNDERKIQLRAKSGYLVWAATMAGCFAASFIAALFRANPWIIFGLFAAAAVQYAAATIIYKYLCRKC